MFTFEDYCNVIFWNFKRMDNAVYNFNVINTLIDGANNKNTNHYCKPIICLMMAIIECVLYDLLLKIKEHVSEKVNVDPEDIEAIKAVDVPNILQCYTNICKKYSLLGTDDLIYGELNTFIPIRNRIHIQNTKKYEPKDEYKIWSADLTKKCGDLFQNIFLFLCSNYPRPEHFHKNPDLSQFPTPWKTLK